MVLSRQLNPPRRKKVPSTISIQFLPLRGHCPQGQSTVDHLARTLPPRVFAGLLTKSIWRDNGGDDMTVDTGFQDAPGARQNDKADEPAAFHFAPTFKIDLFFSLIYVALFIRTWAYCDHTAFVCAIACVFGFLLALCYAGKVAIIASLNKGGGDARTYVI